MFLSKHDKSHQPHEDPYMMLDSTKARVKLGWRPALDLKTSLSWIVEWMKGFQEGANMRSVTEAQIRKYMEITHNSGQSRSINGANTGEDRGS